MTDKNKWIIHHLGKTFITTNYVDDMSDEECNAIRDEYYSLMDNNNALAQMKKLKSGGKMTNHIHRFYIKHLMEKAKLKGAKWSIEEFMQSNPLIRFGVAKIRNFPKVYSTKYSDAKNLEAVFRIGSSMTAPKVSNFPIKTILELLDKYNVNDNYYDFSCGWAVRLMGALTRDINYFGTDPNTELVPALNHLSDDFKRVTETVSDVDIRCQGSETFVSEWTNKIGFAFSSPPYFDLEDYGIGEQSTNDRSYDAWLSEYWTPTVQNIKKYLTEDGILALNIKAIKGFDLKEDMKDIILSEEFDYVESVELKNINRIVLQQNNKDTNEEILIFKKR